MVGKFLTGRVPFQNANFGVFWGNGLKTPKKGPKRAKKSKTAKNAKNAKNWVKWVENR